MLKERITFVFGEDIFKVLIIVFGSNDRHVVEVLCSRANKGNATDIYFFDDVLFRCTRPDGFFKWVEVYDNKIDFGDFIFLQLLAIDFQGPARQDAAKYFGVKRFHAAAQYRRIPGEIFDWDHLVAEFTDKRFGTACGIKSNALFAK